MIEALNTEHSRYRDRKDMWRRYWDFYVGGEQMRRNAGQYLTRRQKEPNDVYAERLGRVFYENYLGSCVDWYAAALFRAEPRIAVETSDSKTRRFYAEFIEDCDCRGTTLMSTARKAFVESMVYGESQLLIDFPRVEGEAQTRAEEDAWGKSRAYLARFSPLDLINWKADAYGAIEWAVIKTEETYQAAFDQPAMITEDRWLYYDREVYRSYRRRRGGAPAGMAVGGGVELVSEGRHALAGVGRAPIVKMSLSDGLWLVNKAALLAEEHFNKSNALGWALHMGLFAMPVIYSEREWQQVVGEAYYLQLGPDDKFGWTEPEGHVFEIAADNLDRLKDEIYRVCYLMNQAAGREAKNLGQSGLSKERDFAVTQEVLRSYGSTVKRFLRQTLELVAKARQDDVKFEITGMDQFDATNFSDELAAAIGLREAGIHSPRLIKEVQKRIALKYLEGATQETKNAVVEEIERGLKA